MTTIIHQVTVQITTREFHPQAWIGSSRTDTLFADYWRCCEILGQPEDTPSEDKKVDISWVLDLGGGNLVRIFNYANGPGFGKELDEIQSFSMSGDRFYTQIIRDLIERSDDG